MLKLQQMPKYSAYKDSGVEWLGEIPKHWEIIPLRFLGKIQTGNTPARENESYFSAKGGVPWVKPDNLGGLSPILESKDFLTTKGALEARIIPQGAVLVCCIGSIGKMGVAGVSLTTNQQINAVIFNSLTISEFEKYLIYSAKGEHERLAVGNVVYILNSDRQKAIRFAIPPLPEQTAIAAFLDKKTAHIDAAVGIKQKQIALLKERKQILIQNAVTQGLNPNAPRRDSSVEWIGEIPKHWEVKRIKYVLDERNERSKIGLETLFMVSQVHGLVVRSEFHEKAEVAQSNIDNKLVYENDLVFNKLKAHLGVFFKSTIEFKGLVSPDYAVYKSKGLIQDLKYLEHLFRHPAYIGQFIIRATGVAEGLIRLYTDDLFDIFIPVPPKDEQEKILQLIKDEAIKFDQAIDLQQQQIDKLKEYKATLINSAVTGKIRVV